jgi:hypothetical protein
MNDGMTLSFFLFGILTSDFCVVRHYQPPPSGEG